MAPKLPPAGLRLNASKPESMLGAMILAPVRSGNRRKRRIERRTSRAASPRSYGGGPSRSRRKHAAAGPLPRSIGHGWTDKSFVDDLTGNEVL